jgi:hypothetical protein
VFVMGYGIGHWDCCAKLLDLQYEKVWAHAWKPLYLPTGAHKQLSLDLARDMFPGHDLPLKKDEARAEALLIADYVRRKMEGKSFPKKRPKRGKKAKKKAKKRARQSRILR